MCAAGLRGLLRGTVPHRFETGECSPRNILYSPDLKWRDISRQRQNASLNEQGAESGLEISTASPTILRSFLLDPFRTRTTATKGERFPKKPFWWIAFMNFESTFSTDNEKAMNGSLSRATFSKYSILIIELPLDAEMGVDRRPIFCKWTGPPTFKPTACATASWKAWFGLSRYTNGCDVYCK